MRVPRFLACSATGLFLIVSSACSRSASSDVRTYTMGDRVELGHLVYTIFESRWASQFGDGPTARVPQHRFFLVRMNVGNTGTARAIVPNMTLEDDQGHSYPEVRNGDAVPEWLGFLRPVTTLEAAAGNVLFDVPPAHYKLRVTDEESQRAALVDIPLTFRSEAPDLPPPNGDPR
ncbi:MAG TPA: hypothetical protein VG096_19745 [Bryobacteraceae bacterium]|nr:hypothetical protein [Bryobacteraceae bacterium]